jgi:hypothetical protein
MQAKSSDLLPAIHTGLWLRLPAMTLLLCEDGMKKMSRAGNASTTTSCMVRSPRLLMTPTIRLLRLVSLGPVPECRWWDGAIGVHARNRTCCSQAASGISFNSVYSPAPGSPDMLGS